MKTLIKVKPSDSCQVNYIYETETYRMNIEPSICGSKCNDLFKYLSLYILNYTHKKSCSLHLYYL